MVLFTTCSHITRQPESIVSHRYRSNACWLPSHHSKRSHTTQPWFLVIMIRRSMCAMSKAGEKARTIVRDPRRKRPSSPAALVDPPAPTVNTQFPAHQQQAQHPLPIQPQQAGLGSFVLMGAGMSIGFAIVGALFGGF